jgi:hypothetical protein
MRCSDLWRVVVPCLALSGPAAAQVIWDMPNVIEKKPKFDTGTVRPRAEVWPRLDPGAVLCKTEADLSLLAARRRGEAVERPNCRLIQAPTAVQIEKRSGPGRTQVSLTGQDGQDGWTDVWLPDRAPLIGGKTITIK